MGSLARRWVPVRARAQVKLTALPNKGRSPHKRGERPATRTALLAADLRAMAATRDDSLKGKRDRALLYFTFASGGRRRS